ncbi:MAG: S41 family peptidase [Clostridiales bacterium]|nr:S41 family peptidase [Clostridiales bacterium]
MNPSSRKRITIIICIATIIIVALLSSLASASYFSAHGLYSVSGHSINQDELNNKLHRLDEVYSILMDQYYQDLDSEVLIQGAIDGMFSAVNDPYTFYYTPEKMASTNADRLGLYVGIGVEVRIFGDGCIYVTRVFDNSPAQLSGIQRGDIIVSADGVDLHADTADELTEAVSHIKGEQGTSVHIGLMRTGESVEMDVLRQSVVSNRVEYHSLDNNILYVRLYDFFGDAVSGMQEAVAYAEEHSFDGMIVDVRGNPGGQLDICVNICDMFLDEGVIVYTLDRQQRRTEYTAKNGKIDIPVAVLVNGESASASEIFAAALKDYSVATIVGTTTYGKGVVQTQYPFSSDGAGMQLTTSAYYTPLGESIDKKGVTPDITVEAAETTQQTLIEGPTLVNDPQLRAAWEKLLSSKEEAQADDAA